MQPPLLRITSPVLLVFLAVLSPVFPLAGSLAETPRPNVVFIITDDQGYGDLSVSGNPVLKTPNLDRLHAESIRLVDYHVSPTCSPTRAALMSGHWSNRTGVWHTIMGRSLLREGETTWGEVFSASGYATGMFGKWHLGDNYPFRPEDRGFQEVVRHGGGGVGQTPDVWDNAYFDDAYHHNGVVEEYQGYCTDVYFREARRFIEQSKARGEPFLAYITTNAPHAPFHAPEKYWRPYLRDGLSEKEAIFFGMIANIDENVGALRKWLEGEGLAENTIFIFTTDNGTTAGDGVFNAGMRGRKGSAYDGGHRVPFFIRWPAGGIDQARDIDALTAHVDILPTLIDLCGLESPAGYSFDGRSLVPLLFDLPVGWPDRILVTDTQRVVDPIQWRLSSTMTSRWRLIDGVELYDIKADPGQTRDLASTEPGVVQRLRAGYEAWWRDLEPGFAAPIEIVVGNRAENPSNLTAHDWLTDEKRPPWNQAFIREGEAITGRWALRVDRAGRYRVELRRWPAETHQPITAPLPKGRPVPGMTAYRETPGESLPAISAQLHLGGQTFDLPVKDGDLSADFMVTLPRGPTTLVADFILADGTRVGAYYVRVEYLAD